MRNKEAAFSGSINDQPYRLRAGNLASLSALAAAFLPKCPLCLMSVLSVAGLGSVISASWLLSLTLVFLGAAILPLAIRARRDLKPLFAGLAAVILILLGKFYFACDSLMYAGVIILFAASFWSNRRKNRAACRNECDC